MNRQCKNCRARCTGAGKEGNASQCTFYTEQGSSLPYPWRDAMSPPKVPIWMNPDGFHAVRDWRNAKGRCEMKKIEICKMCEEYSSDTKCEHEESCKVTALFEENKSLRKENRELKSKVSELENKMSYMVNPLSLGDRNNQMGW